MNRKAINKALDVLALEGSKLYHPESIPGKWECIGAAIYNVSDDFRGVADMAAEFFEQWNGHSIAAYLRGLKF